MDCNARIRNLIPPSANTLTHLRASAPSRLLSRADSPPPAADPSTRLTDHQQDDPTASAVSNRPAALGMAWSMLPRISMLCCMHPDTDDAATLEEYLNSVQTVLTSDLDLHQPDPFHRRTPLHWACLFGGPALLDLLARHGALADLSSEDVLGHTPLGCVINLRQLPGKAALVSWLLSRGARIDLLPERGAELLYEDFLTPALASRLIRLGVPVEGNRSLSPLALACARGDLALAECLLAHGASLHWRNIHERSLLHDGELDVALAQLMVRRGLPVDARDAHGQTPLMLACASNNLPLVRMLVSLGASLTAKTLKGLSVLDAAQQAGQEMVQLITQLSQPAGSGHSRV